MTAKRQSSQLAIALHDKSLVRFNSRFEDRWFEGYVLDIGPKFFLFAFVGDGIWFNGFECFRLSDVRKLRAAPNASFIEAALRKRKERIPKKPRIDLANTSQLLLSAGWAFDLISIHRELIYPGESYIGHVIGVQNGHLELHEIDPGAKWDEEPNKFRVSEITRVGFGGDYENALQLVGGSKP